MTRYFTQIQKYIYKTASAVLITLLLTVFAVAPAVAMPVSSNFAIAVCSSGHPAVFDTNVCCPTASETDATKCTFEKYINPLIALLSAIVGVVVVISLIIAGIQYSSSSGDAAKVQAAKKRITNSLIALLVFFFLFAAIQWLVPGGLL